jgi:hypothetical protein
MPGGTGLDQAPLIVYPELVTVDVAEVDFHSGKFGDKPLQKPIHFGLDKLDHSRIYGYVFVTIDLNPHAFLCSAFTRAAKDFLEVGFEAGIDDSILRVNLTCVFVGGPSVRANLPRRHTGEGSIAQDPRVKQNGPKMGEERQEQNVSQ